MSVPISANEVHRKFGVFDRKLEGNLSMLYYYDYVILEKIEEQW